MLKETPNHSQRLSPMQRAALHTRSFLENIQSQDVWRQVAVLQHLHITTTMESGYEPSMETLNFLLEVGVHIETMREIFPPQVQD